MSFLFGGGRPQLTSEQKIANAETEVEMVSDMFSRHVIQIIDVDPLIRICSSHSVYPFPSGWHDLPFSHEYKLTSLHFID